MTTTQAATNAAAKLTNERIIQIADETRTAESRDGDYILPISFARAIESAVLASRVPAGLETLTSWDMNRSLDIMEAVHDGFFYAAADVELWAATNEACVSADEAKLYRDLTGDAMKLGYDGIPAALEALRASHTGGRDVPGEQANTLLRLALQEAGEIAQSGLRPKLSSTDLRTLFKRIINCARAGLSESEALAATPSTAAVRAAEWISVEDRLPEPGLYLVASSWGVRPAFRPDQNISERWQEAISETDEGDYGFTSFAKGTFRITHWMPLPEAPSTLSASPTTQAQGGEQ